MTVCKTDCVKVENVPENVSDTSIKVKFMHKALVKGEVTLVKKCGRTAYVYFADYQGWRLKIFVLLFSAKTFFLFLSNEIFLYCMQL